MKTRPHPSLRYLIAQQPQRPTPGIIGIGICTATYNGVHCDLQPGHDGPHENFLRTWQEPTLQPLS